MVCSELAVTLQCLGKLYLGTVYSGKQRNVYEHIYKTLFPNLLQTPQYKNILALRKTQGNIYTLALRKSQGNTLKIKTFWPH